MQTITGGQKMRQTMIKKFKKPGMTDAEAEQAWKDHMRAIASQGGKAGNTGGFYKNPEAARVAGEKGVRVRRYRNV